MAKKKKKKASKGWKRAGPFGSSLRSSKTNILEQVWGRKFYILEQQKLIWEQVARIKAGHHLRSI